MDETVLKNLLDKTNYIQHLDKDILENTKIIDESEKECNEISRLIHDVTMLGNYPEKEALIPLSKKFYVKGKIVHTGEHYIHKSAQPDSYVFLRTLNKTIESLNSDIKEKEKDIEKAKHAQCQLEERKQILIGDQELFPTLEITDTTENLPNKIISDKGVAVKVGDFYEILEYETNV